MDASLAAKILCPDASLEEQRAQAEVYQNLQESAASAAARGYVDTVIAPEDTRKYVIGALEMLFYKKERIIRLKKSTEQYRRGETS